QWGDDELVAEGSTDTENDDFAADHPIAMLTENSSDKRVQLFVQSQREAGDHDELIQIESEDEIGDDFGLDCDSGSSSCTDSFLSSDDGYMAIEADGTGNTNFVDQARHSRVMWPYVDDPIVDAGTDEPVVMYQIERPSSGDCSDSGGYDDIGWADGEWDTGTSQWDWTIEMDGASPDCPVIHIDDGHDNSTIPLPGGESKMYFKDYTTTPEVWKVIYWDGSDWVDEAEVDFVWDSASTGPSDKCIANIHAIVHKDGSTIHEGMFFRLLDDDADECKIVGGGFDDDGTVDPDDAAIVFAELAN
ncbi:MAG TPA: hypothetical protein QGF58_03685, partial [Myxococcota bacterium]|nr:hypothetical protein [Myxococcota bacterium]